MGVMRSSKSSVDVPERSQELECAAPKCRPSLALSEASSGLGTIPDSVLDLSDPGEDDNILRKVRSSKEGGQR